jgi:hypothetical protein
VAAVGKTLRLRNNARNRQQITSWEAVMGLFDKAKDKASDASDQAKDKAGEGIDKGEDTVNDKTGGKFEDKVSEGGDQAKDKLDDLGGDKKD